MHRVLIVDDEKIIRIGLQSIINWEDSGFKVVGIAADGIQALKVMESESVDVVITDIKMPNMDGLTLLKELKNNKFDGEVIMLTNHGEFELAREALRYGVHDYLLKATLRPEELIKTLETIKTKLGERTSQRVDKKQDIQEIDYEELRVIQEVFEQVISKQGIKIERVFKENYRFILIKRVKSKYEKQNKEINPLSYYSGSINNIVKEIIALENEVHIFYDEDWALYVLPKREVGDKEELIRLALQIQNHIKMYTNTKVISVVGEGFINTVEFVRFLEKCIRASKSVFYKGYNKVILQEEYQEVGNYVEIPQDKFLKELKLALECGGYDEAMEIEKNWFQYIKNMQLPEEQVDEFINKLMNELIVDYGMYLDKDKDKLKEIAIKYRRCTTLDEVKDVLGELTYTICNYILQIKDTHYRKEVVEIMDYIAQNIDKKITLASLSEEVNMNESYISRLFKSETGTNLINYINMIKMEKAKELLKKPDMIVKDVANALGFEEQSYFNRMFKKYFGLNPKEYKKQM